MDWLFVKAFLTMLMIVGLMFGLLLVVRKYLSKPGFSDENMRVLSSLNLQPKKAIYLVKVFNKVMLVGVSDGSMASLGEITDAETLDRVESASQKKRAKGFPEILKGLTLK